MNVLPSTSTTTLTFVKPSDQILYDPGPGLFLPKSFEILHRIFLQYKPSGEGRTGKYLEGGRGVHSFFDYILF